MTVNIISSDNLNWTNILARYQHDIYHLPACVDIFASQEDGVVTGIEVKDSDLQMFFPVIMKNLNSVSEKYNNYFDAFSPYGYPGPLCSSSDYHAIQKLLLTYREEGRQRGFVSTFLRLHPHINPYLLWSLAVDGCADIYLVEHGRNVYIDLAKSKEDIFRSFRSGHKEVVRKLQRLNYKVIINDWSYYLKFQEIYTQAMLVLNASPYYLFDQHYFLNLYNKMCDKMILAMVLNEKDFPVAGALFFVENGIVQYHLSGSDANYKKWSPNTLLLHDVIMYAKDIGANIFHLGGGLGGKEDSLFGFKSGFSQDTKQFATLRIIHDRDKYNELVFATQGSNDHSDADFFPLYRKSKK